MKLIDMIKATNVHDRMPYVDREPGFTLMHEFIKDKADSGISPIIVETGCLRMKNDFTAGASTMIFDQMAAEAGGQFISIDINPDHVALARGELRHPSSEVICGDSVKVLENLKCPIDLLYLDSYDLDLNNQHPSALHHLHELAMAWKNLRRPAMVAVDDNFSGLYRPLEHRYAGSKGAYVRQNLTLFGFNPVLDLQQTVWIIT